jgi:protein polybromo-1
MKIQKKLKKDSYEDLEDLAADLNIVFENAKQYNIEDSKIYQDAVKLQAIMNSKKQELMRNKDSSSWEVASVRSRQATPDGGSTTADDGGGQKRNDHVQSVLTMH